MTSPSRSADDIIRDLQGRFAETLDAVLPPHGEVALVDFPNYSNIGDSAIWLGQMAYLHGAGRVPAYRSAIKDFDDADMRRKTGTGPILIQGGGNFGTLWPKHEAFRLHLLREHRDRAIIQLPQSIHYDQPESARALAAAIAAHGNFTLLVRDQKSLAFARAHFDCAIHLCPDAAIMLGRQPRGPARAPIFGLMRTDHEKTAGGDAVLPPGVLIDDWIEEDPASKRYLKLFLKLRRLITPNSLTMRALRQQAYAEWRLRRGLAMLSQGEFVVTDRLHAHILSLLLDIPHVLLDNSYGKVGGFADQWTRDYVHLIRATSREEAFALALAQVNSRNATMAG